MSDLSAPHIKTLTKKIEGLELAYIRASDDSDSNSQTIPSFPKKQPIIFLHGQFSDKRVWEAQFDDPLLNQKYELFAWDAPGYGKSEMWPHFNPSALNFALMLRGWLENEITQPAVFVGHGIGALMACAYAARFPLLVDGIIMIAPQIGSNRSSMFRQRQMMQDSNMLNTFGNQAYATARAKSLLYVPDEFVQSIDSFDNLAQLDKTESRLHSEQREQTDAVSNSHIQSQIQTCIDKRIEQENSLFRLNYLKILSGLNEIEPDALEAMTWTLMNEDIEEYRHYFHKKAEVWIGQEDKMVNEAEARRLAVRYHSRMEIFAEAGHMLPLEQPTMFNQHLLRFMHELEQEKLKESEW